MLTEKQGVQLAKSCRESNLEKRENKKKALESIYQHLCIICIICNKRKVGEGICDIWFKIQPKIIRYVKPVMKAVRK